MATPFSVSRQTDTSSARGVALHDGTQPVGRTLVYSLTLGTAEAWAGLATVLRARLSDQERACLAMVPVAASDEPGAGLPIPPFDGVVAEASFRADMADPDEMAAYCLSSFNRMARDRQAAFLGFVKGRAAA